MIRRNVPFWTLAWIVFYALHTFGCVRHVTATVEPPPNAQQTYTIPWDAKDTDLVCADTIPSVNWKPCMSLRRFRELVLDKQVTP